jgi:hypothetical protein
MLHKENHVPISGIIILLLVYLNAFILKMAFIQNKNWYEALIITLPLLIVAVYDNRARSKILK